MKAFSRKLLSALLALSLLLTLSPAALASDALGEALVTRTEALHRGVTLAEGTFWSSAYSDLRQENYIIYEANTAVTPIVTYGGYVTDRTSVAAAARALEAQGLRVVAGINGDYYDTSNGIPLGTTLTDGVLRVSSASGYAAGFRADGTAILGAPALKITAAGDAADFTVSAVNQVRYTYGGIYLYTYDFNARHTTGTNAAGYDLVCSALSGRLSIGETLTLSVDEILPEATDTVVPEGKYVLTANLLSGDANLEHLRSLSVGDTLTITVTAEDDGWNDVDYMIGALYQLVENGEVCKGLAAGAAPRTAIGQRADGSLVLYTIDGRQSGYSIGASLTQVAQRMVELGCVTALSLDGGGSTSMAVTLPESSSAGTYNSPSDGSLRAVTNHVFLVASAEPSGELSHISLRAESERVLAGAQVKLYAAAIDTSYLPMERAVSVASDRGSVYKDDAGSVIFSAPQTGGTVTVGAKAGGKYTTAELTVVETPDELALTHGSTALRELQVAPSSTFELTARAYADHLPLLAQNSCFTWSVDGGIGTVDENGIFTAAEHAAYGTLTVRAGETELSLPVYVTTDPNVLLDGFEGAQTVFTANTDKSFVRFGSASARWDYSAEHPTDAEEAVLRAEQSFSFPSGYDRAALWVYGDGSGALLSLTTDAGETDSAALSFTGWQRLVFVLPEGSSVITAFALRTESGMSGTLYLDQLIAGRTDAADTAAPEISLALSEDGTALTGKVFDAVDGGTLPTLRVTLDGKAIAYTYDHQTGALHALLPTADGNAHRITVTAGDASGNLARAGVSITPQELAPAFPDTAEHWANTAISYLRANGIAAGNDHGLYTPDNNITRQEFAVMLCRAFAPEHDFSSTELPFADNDDIAPWALESVRATYALGITKGSTVNGRLCFSPTAPISRQEALTMLGRLLERGYIAPDRDFADGDQIADWAREHINTLCAVGAVSGYADGSIRPTEPITRAQVAAILFALA